MSDDLKQGAKYMIFAMIAANLLIGLLIGVTGIGFMLPMFYLIVVGMTTTEAMAFSFCAFVLSGILSTIIFAKKKAMDWRIGTWVSVGSVLGTMAGVSINLMLPEYVIKYILYIVVLLSGFSILLPRKEPRVTDGSGFFQTWSAARAAACILIGIVTGCICSAGGAGGPILVIPILTLLGMPIHTVIGTAMYNSIFIALIAFPRYFAAAGGIQIPYFSFLPLLLVLYGAGVLVGGHYSFCVNQMWLKRTIALLCIVVAVYKIAG